MWVSGWAERLWRVARTVYPAFVAAIVAPTSIPRLLVRMPPALNGGVYERVRVAADADVSVSQHW